MQRHVFQMQKPRSSLRYKSSGFTLVELLIVIAIIALLMSIFGVATMSMIGTARVNATSATIVKIQGLIQQRIDAIGDRRPDQTIVTSNGLPTRFPGNPKAVETLARKIMFRQAFPQTWSEVHSDLITSLPFGSPAIPSPSPATTPGRQARESAEVLHFILTRANVLGYPPVGDDVFSTSEVRDTDSNNWPEFIDGWGEPLRFYRWPTRLVRGGAWAAGAFTPTATARLLIPPLPTTAAELSRDSHDKFGLLKVGNPGGVLSAANASFFEQGNAPMMNAFANLGRFNTPDTFSLPLIISGGPDKATGLHEPSDTSVNAGYWGAVNSAAINNTFDDISNYNTRSGGK